MMNGNGAKSHAFCCAILTIINVHVDHSDQPDGGKKAKMVKSQKSQVSPSVCLRLLSKGSNRG